MGFLWDFCGSSVGFLWDSYGDSMIDLCGFDDISLGCQWNFYGNFYCASIEFLSDFYGIPMGCLWDSYGISMGFLWDFYGIPIYRGSMWFL